MLRRRRSRFADLIRSTVAVHTLDGTSFVGVLIGEWDDAISLASARIVETDGAKPVDGETLIPLAQIRFAQAGVVIENEHGRLLQLRRAETA